MLTPPSDLTAEQVSAYLEEHWGIAEAVVTYAPVGHGSHNWSVEAGGSRWFVKAYRGPDWEFVQATQGSVAALGESGLSCVLAPVRSNDGTALAQVSPEWVLAVFPYVTGRNADFSTDDRVLVASAVGRLHAAEPPANPLRWEPGWFQPELRQRLANDLDRPWSDGPYGDRARTLLASHRRGVEDLLALSDRLVERLAADDQPYVMTHGEPHGGNSMVDATGNAVLVDCDAMMLAPRERDLRLVLHASHRRSRGLDDTAVLAAYREAAGQVEPRAWAIELFRAEWHLIEIARYASLFSGPHADSADTAARIAWLEGYVPVAQNWPELTASAGSISA